MTTQTPAVNKTSRRAALALPAAMALALSIPLASSLWMLSKSDPAETDMDSTAIGESPLSAHRRGASRTRTLADRLPAFDELTSEAGAPGSPISAGVEFRDALAPLQRPRADMPVLDNAAEPPASTDSTALFTQDAAPRAGRVFSAGVASAKQGSPASAGQEARRAVEPTQRGAGSFSNGAQAIQRALGRSAGAARAPQQGAKNWLAGRVAGGFAAAQVAAPPLQPSVRIVSLGSADGVASLAAVPAVGRAVEVKTGSGVQSGNGQSSANPGARTSTETERETTKRAPRLAAMADRVLVDVVKPSLALLREEVEAEMEATEASRFQLGRSLAMYGGWYYSPSHIRAMRAEASLARRAAALGRALDCIDRLDADPELTDPKATGCLKALHSATDAGRDAMRDMHAGRGGHGAFGHQRRNGFWGWDWAWAWGWPAWAGYNPYNWFYGPGPTMQAAFSHAAAPLKSASHELSDPDGAAEIADAAAVDYDLLKDVMETWGQSSCVTRAHLGRDLGDGVVHIGLSSKAWERAAGRHESWPIEAAKRGTVEAIESYQALRQGADLEAQAPACGGYRVAKVKTGTIYTTKASAN